MERDKRFTDIYLYDEHSVKFGRCAHTILDKRTSPVYLHRCFYYHIPIVRMFLKKWNIQYFNNPN